jgi:hypothetical protein
MGSSFLVEMRGLPPDGCNDRALLLLRLGNLPFEGKITW